jgi:RND family efflux transporter MFP subunit
MNSRRACGALALAVVLAGPVALAQTPPEALVRVDAVRDEPLSQTVPVVGRIVARRAGNVAARVGGPIARFHAEVGDHVEVGQVIATLDREMLEVERELAKSRTAEARARLETRRAWLGLAKLERGRFERLKQTQAAAKSSYDDARQQEVIAQAELREAAAAIASAEAQLREAEIELARVEIKAPYTGVITRRLVEAGDYVQPGAALVHMISDTELEVEADVPHERIGGLKPGAEVRLSLDDGTEHRAWVRAVIPEENRLTRTRLVRFIPTFEGEKRPLAAEQSVTVHVPVGAARNVLSVHKDAVTRRGSQSLVYVVEDATAELRSVQLGEAVGNRFEVLGGLQAGDTVVVRGNERLQPGDRVRVGGAPS